jgi:hypothetical protein
VAVATEQVAAISCIDLQNGGSVGPERLDAGFGKFRGESGDAAVGLFKHPDLFRTVGKSAFSFVKRWLHGHEGMMLVLPYCFL